MAFTFLVNVKPIIKGQNHKQLLPQKEEEK